MAPSRLLSSNSWLLHVSEWMCWLGAAFPGVTFEKTIFLRHYKESMRKWIII